MATITDRNVRSGSPPVPDPVYHHALVAWVNTDDPQKPVVTTVNGPSTVVENTPVAGYTRSANCRQAVVRKWPASA